ncbi:MAG TPA: proline dehydrogenase family protein [Nitrososphaeraceae archaeon]
MSSAKDCNNKGIAAILNLLGEHINDTTAIEKTVKEYSLLLHTLRNNGIDGCISVKPTQLGLGIGYDICLYNLKQIVTNARTVDKFVWLDIESLQFVENTIAIYLELLEDYKQVGIAIQSYLKRSSSDILHLLEEGANIRLVKGAYRESEKNAFQSISKINSNFSRLMKLLFESSNSSNIFAIASHDSKLIHEAIQLATKFGTNKSQFEFQMLMGIHNEMKIALVQRGFKVSEYIPYGSQWMAYSVRRLKERKRNILLLARSLIQKD